MNNVNLIGNVTRDFELKTSASGADYVNFSIGITRSRQRDRTDFINITAFGKTAEICAKYLNKGSRVGITGELQTDKYTGKDGTTKYTTQVVISNIDFLNAKGESKQSAEEEITDYTPQSSEELPF